MRRLEKVNKVMSIYQLVVKARFGGSDEYRNVHHYEFFSYVPDVAQQQELVDGVDTAYRTYMETHYSNSLTVYEYDLRRVDIADQPTLTYTATGGAWFGDETSEALPTQDCALSTFKALSTFPRTSRTYHFPMGEVANVGGGTVQSGVITNMELWGNAMLEIDITGALNADKQAVRYGGNPRVVVAHNDLTIATADNVFATQRRRKRGKGI